MRCVLAAMVGAALALGCGGGASPDAGEAGISFDADFDAPFDAPADVDEDAPCQPPDCSSMDRALVVRWAGRCPCVLTTAEDLDPRNPGVQAEFVVEACGFPADTEVILFVDGRPTLTTDSASVELVEMTIPDDDFYVYALAGTTVSPWLFCDRR